PYSALAHTPSVSRLFPDRNLELGPGVMYCKLAIQPARVCQPNRAHSKGERIGQHYLLGVHQISLSPATPTSSRGRPHAAFTVSASRRMLSPTEAKLLSNSSLRSRFSASVVRGSRPFSSVAACP